MVIVVIIATTQTSIHSRNHHFYWTSPRAATKARESERVRTVHKTGRSFVACVCFDVISTVAAEEEVDWGDTQKMMKIINDDDDDDNCSLNGSFGPETMMSTAAGINLHVYMQYYVANGDRNEKRGAGV